MNEFTHPAYLAGKQAYRNRLTFERNPYTTVERVTKLGTIVYKDQAERSLWACGFRDEKANQSPRVQELRDFVQRRSRRHSFRR